MSWKTYSEYNFTKNYKNYNDEKEIPTFNINFATTKKKKKKKHASYLLQELRQWGANIEKIHPHVLLGAGAEVLETTGTRGRFSDQMSYKKQATFMWGSGRIHSHYAS